MTKFSDDERRFVEEIIVTSPLSLHTLPNGMWEESLQVWVNGLLRIPLDDYTVDEGKLSMAEELLEGDTLRVSGIRLGSDR